MTNKFHGKNKDLYLATMTTHDVYVDKYRIDIYTPTGTITKPFKQIQDAIDYVSSIAVAGQDWTVKIESGQYTENLVLENTNLNMISLVGIGGVVGLVPASGNAIQSIINNDNLSKFRMVNIEVTRPVVITGPNGGTTFSDVWIQDCKFVSNATITLNCISNFSLMSTYIETGISLTNVTWFYVDSGRLNGLLTMICDSTVNKPSGFTSGTTFLNSVYEMGNITLTKGGTAGGVFVSIGSRINGSSGTITNPSGWTLQAYNSFIRGNLTNAGTFQQRGSFVEGTFINTGTWTNNQKNDQIKNESTVTGTTTKDALETLNIEKTSIISVNTTYTVKASGGDFTTIQEALDSLKGKWINSDVSVTISVDAGLFTHTNTILFRHPLGNRINIVGAAPVITTITSLASWVGTPGNYSVTLNVANTAGMVVGEYCLVSGTTTGTGEYQAIKGCWEITGIPSPTQVTVKNTYRKAIPTLTITGGSLNCLKTTLKFNNCDGFQVGGATGYIYNLAIVGDGVSAKDGINISQRGYYYGVNVIYLGEPSATYSIGINGFGRYGIANTSTAEVWIINGAISGCGNYGLYAYNHSKIAASGIVSSGNGNIGIYATDGSFITCVSSFAVGNSTVGFYAYNRAGINAQYSHAVGNVYSGFQANGFSLIDARNTKALNNGYHGYNSGSNSLIYATSSSAIGNGAAINYYGYYATNDGTIRADSSTGSGNFSGDYRAEDSSFIKVTGYTGTPTFSPLVDTMGNNGAIIRSVVATPIQIVDAIKNGSTVVGATVNDALNTLGAILPVPGPTGPTGPTGSGGYTFNLPATTIANGESIQLYRFTVPAGLSVNVWAAGLASVGGAQVAGAKIQIYNETDIVEAYSTNSTLVTGNPITTLSLAEKDISIKILNDSGLAGDFHGFISITVE